MKYSMLLVLLAVIIALATSQPMTNDEDAAALVSLDSGEKVRDLPHMVIAPKKTKAMITTQEQGQLEVEPQRAGMFDTIVEQLHAAGVQTADKRQLQTLSYKELTRLLALWHLTQRRNYYDANENRAPPAFDENDGQLKPQMHHEAK